MVKNRFGFVIALSILLVCSRGPLPEAKAPARPFRIVCTILPVYCLTLNLAAEVPGLQVELLLPPSQGCPHDYDLTPGDMIKISRADLVIANGLGMEEFLGKPLQRINPNTRVIQAAEKVPPLLARPLERRLSSRPAQSKHDHQQPQSVNGHAWVSPQAAIQMVETIAQALAKLDPFYTALYQENARRYSHKLTGLLEEMRAVIKQSQNPRVITFHDVFDYLARDTGLKVAGVIQPQLGVEPAPRDMVHLVKMIRSQKVAAIFSEPQVSDRIAKALSRETGVPCYELDPVATGKPMAETYETAMKQNISVLRTALK